jgi:hypothetical protein
MYMQRYMEYMQYMRNAGFGMQQEWGQPAMVVQDPGIVEPSAAMTGVQELDRWTAGDVVGGDRAVFMVLYTNPAECPFCVAFAPQFQQLGLHFQGEPAVIIAKADGVAQSPLVEEYGMTDAPLPTALYFAPGAKTPVAYDGPSHYTSMIEFLEERVPGIVKDGQLAVMRLVARNFMTAATPSEMGRIRDEAAATQKGLASEQADHAERYLAVMDRVLKHGRNWLAAQKNSLITKVQKLQQEQLEPLPANPSTEPARYMEQLEGLKWKMVRVQRQLHVVEEFLSAGPSSPSVLSKAK